MSSSPPRPLRLARLLLGAVAFAVVAAGCGDEPQQLVGYDMAPAPQVGDFTLTDTTSGAEVPLRADPGQLLMVFLGFTNCPDACPLALADIRTALDDVGDEAAARVDVAMVTVDPVRDTPEVLSDFVQQFVPDATGLRTEDATALQAVVDAFGATYESTHDHAGQTLEVGHTDHIYALDDTGTVALTWTAEMTAGDIAADLALLLGRA